MKKGPSLANYLKIYDKLSVSYSFLQKYLPVTGADETYALFEFNGKDEKLKRAPINLSVVLDLSQLINQKVLQHTKVAMKSIINQLKKTDRINVVACDGKVKTVLPPQKVAQKNILIMEIDKLKIEGMTDIQEGLILGCENLVNKDTDSFINRLILISDGQANKNINNFQMLMKEIEEYHNLGLVISTIGVGNDFKEDLLENIAENGRGNYYFANNEEQIPGFISQEMKKIISAVTHQTYLAIFPKNGVQIKEVYGFKVQIFEERDFGENNDYLSYWVSLGDLYNHETKLILVQFSIPSISEGIHDLFEVRWYFKDIKYNIKHKCKNSPVSFSTQLTIPAEFTNDPDKLTNNLNVDVEKKVEIIKTAQKIEEAMRFFDKEDFATGKGIIYKFAEQIKDKAEAFNDDRLIYEIKFLFKQLDNLHYSKQNRKELHQQKYNLKNLR